ncbi:hypothetical protein PsYK624_011550 [Phanerochaete sordida]|uniref:F-box domain-containing protein n=1 Tax=Phanerochaete sordida TaxID=48140 RepID=A0A9P3L8J5_9APHY|nr:hypothetical protein PsYK624_011550 [Phanerochaete sordida]
MHRCLCITEVLRVIAYSVDDNDVLFSMSLTCRAFLEPALDALWYELSDPDPLIELFPKSKRGAEPKGHLTLIDTPTEEEWARFEYYARRVRILRYWTPIYDSPELDDWLGVDWDSVLQYCPEKQLLPRLHTFESDFQLISDWYYLFIQPPLRHLTLTYWELLDPEIPSVEALHKCAQTLESLEVHIIGWDVSDPQAISSLSHVVSQMRALKIVNVDNLLPQAVAHLAGLHTLRELHFSVETLDGASTPLPFPVLERLQVKAHTPNVNALTCILRRLQAPALRALELEYDPGQDSHSPTAAYVRSTFGAVEHLVQLHKFSFGVRTRREPVEASRIDDIASLLTLRSLEHIDLDTLPLVLAPADIDRIARAWPHATTLLLGNWADGTLQLPDLLPLAKSCPRLRTLGVPLAIPETFKLGALPEFGTGLPLRELRTSADGPAFSEDAAVFLACTFPCAQLQTWNQDDQDAVQRINKTAREFLQATIKRKYVA